MDKKIQEYLEQYVNTQPKKKKVKVTASITYSKSFEVEVAEGYTDADLKEAVKQLGVLPNDILTDEHIRLRKHIRKLETRDWIIRDLMDYLISERDKHSPWHEDEFEVVEEF